MVEVGIEVTNSLQEVSESGWRTTADAHSGTPCPLIAAGHIADFLPQEPAWGLQLDAWAGSALCWAAWEHLRISAPEAALNQWMINATAFLPHGSDHSRNCFMQVPVRSLTVSNTPISLLCMGFVFPASLLHYQDHFLNKLLDSKSLSESLLLQEPNYSRRLALSILHACISAPGTV